MGGLRTPPAVVPGWVTLLPEDKGSRWETMDRDSSLKSLHKHGRANRNSAPQCGVIFGCILSKVRWRCFGVLGKQGEPQVLEGSRQGCPLKLRTGKQVRGWSPVVWGPSAS